jgi:phosphatidylglycerophosphatase C
VTQTVVFDLDKVLLGGDAATLFLHGPLRRRPARLLPLLLAAPVLLVGAAVPQLRPPAARGLTRLALGSLGSRRPSDVEGIAEAFGEALIRKPEAAVADALARARRHRAEGEAVVVATGCEEVLARGFLRAVGLGELDVVGSTGSLRPPRARRAMGEEKARMLAERGYPPPWRAVYSDSITDLPLFAGTPRPVLVNAGEDAVRKIERILGRRPETVMWR